ncbi:NUDIX hydrolase [Oligoflexia bacterium]|nr:NUDIX hydrolase [Oligoflexia bacterium]
MSNENPWKTVGSKVVYENQWITVREDQVIRPDGAAGIYGVVETRIATGVVALSEDNQIYLVGQYRYPIETYSWEIVEGGAESETPLEAAQRELQEEAGLLAAKWTQLGEEVHLSNCVSAEVGVLFLAKELSTVAPNPDGTEVLALRKVPFSEAVAMVDNGEITDAMSIIGILRAEKLLGPVGGVTHE